MSVVSNSSPLILFAKIGQLDLLRALYEEVFISAAVHKEIVEQGASRPGSAEVAAADWIKVEPVVPTTDAPATENLGAGETEAIALAKARSLILLVDDPAGRNAATAAGVPITGSAGVLLAAKRRGLLTTVRPTLDALVAAQLRLDEALYHRLLELAGEGQAE